MVSDPYKHKTKQKATLVQQPQNQGIAHQKRISKVHSHQTFP